VSISTIFCEAYSNHIPFATITDAVDVVASGRRRRHSDTSGHIALVKMRGMSDTYIDIFETLHELDAR
jgi:hypothetical protein